METDGHKWLKRIALKFLREKGMNAVAREVAFKVGIADTVGVHFKRQEVRIVECKYSLKDYLRDKKLFNLDLSYYPECHYFYIICPKDIIPIDKVVDNIGLIYANDDDTYTVVKKPKKNTTRLKTLYTSTLHRIIHRLSNEVYFKDEKQYIDVLQGKYSRKAHICFAAIRCPKCRHVTKELISTKKDMQITCKHCKSPVDIQTANIRVITGFNQTFISALNKLLMA